MRTAQEEVSAKAAADPVFAERAYRQLSLVNGYPETFSVFEGEEIVIRVARKPGRLPSSQDVFVQKIEVRNVTTHKTIASPRPAERVQIFEQVPANYRDGGAGYMCRVVLDTKGWPTGVYECVIHDNTGESSKNIYFNIKPRSMAGHDLICVLPTFTWQAYNRSAGGSFYSSNLGSYRTISLHRPLAPTTDNFISAAIPFLGAFASGGVKVACVDSWDLHHGYLPEGDASVMALLTHDEYWSEPMRMRIDQFLKNRGALLVLAGNTCWWKIEVEGFNISVRKGKNKSGWRQSGNPEENTFVSSFRYAGYAAERARKKKAYRDIVKRYAGKGMRDAGAMHIVDPDHSIFRGVKLGPDQNFGGSVPIMYREIDGVPLNQDGTIDTRAYKSKQIKPHIIATGLAFRRDQARTVGVIVEAKVHQGYVVNMGTFGWSRGLILKDDAVRQVVLNAYSYCRFLAGKDGGEIFSLKFQPAPIWAKVGARMNLYISQHRFVRKLASFVRRLL